ncbi:MAG: hypothetical protein QW041_00850 [Candidatus Pacearchaeota archaeon]
MEKMNEQFKSITKTNIHFHWHDCLRGKELSKELSKFDYGIIINFIDNSVIRKEFTDISFATKVFTYFEAGIPVINPVELKFTSKIIGDAGFSISYNNLKNLSQILNSKDYNAYLKAIKAM